jgi:hypothetical protein
MERPPTGTSQLGQANSSISQPVTTPITHPMIITRVTLVGLQEHAWRKFRIGFLTLPLGALPDCFSAGLARVAPNFKVDARIQPDTNKILAVARMALILRQYSSMLTEAASQ